jgi:hypothetical protein
MSACQRARRALQQLGAVIGLGALAALSAGCAVGVAGDADYPPGDYPPGDYPVGAYDDYPPDAYIATADPYYFDGHASYWYGNRWYYRDGGHWAHYDHEPPALYQRRIQAAPARHSYEPYRGHAPARQSASHGGGRGGGHGHR